MSEEEILEKIEKIIKYFKSQEYILNGQKIYEIIQDLLDLYNELKEKNASLQKEIKLMKSININDNYIRKDKIKNKIKELENLYKNKYFHIDYVKEILEELLEENNKCK